MRGFFSILLHLPRYLRLAWRLFRDPAVPARLKWIVGGALLYTVSPLDLIPDFTVVGLLEDLLFLVFSIRNLVGASPPEIVRKHALEIAGKTSGKAGGGDSEREPADN